MAPPDPDPTPPAEGPTPTGAVAPARDPQDGTPTRPSRDPREEPGVDEPLAAALEAPLEAGDEIPQPGENDPDPARENPRA